MTIRKRMAADVANAGLGAAAGIHLLWAIGVSWPANSMDELADLVTGVRPFPPPALTLAVVALIVIGMALVHHESRATAAPKFADRSTFDKLVRVAAIGVPVVLGARGLGGLVFSVLELGDATDLFRRWDARLYSPLCLVLAAFGAVAVFRGP